MAGIVGYIVWFEVARVEDPQPPCWLVLLLLVLWPLAILVARAYGERFL